MGGTGHIFCWGKKKKNKLGRCNIKEDLPFLEVLVSSGSGS